MRRVYKGMFMRQSGEQPTKISPVKQELFMLDVGNCVTSLKKVVQELRPSETCLQMANPVARYLVPPLSQLLLTI